MKNVVLIFMFLSVVGLTLTSCTAQVTERLSPLEFKDKIENEEGSYFILDVRTDEEIAQGKISGAEQLDFYTDDFESELMKLDKQATYYVYCAAGGRSGKAASKMNELGFKQVYDLKGGMNAWKAAGLAVE